MTTQDTVKDTETSYKVKIEPPPKKQKTKKKQHPPQKNKQTVSVATTEKEMRQ